MRAGTPVNQFWGPRKTVLWEAQTHKDRVAQITRELDALKAKQEITDKEETRINYLKEIGTIVMERGEWLSGFLERLTEEAYRRKKRKYWGAIMDMQKRQAASVTNTPATI